MVTLCSASFHPSNGYFFIISVGHLVRHSNIFCRTFIRNVPIVRQVRRITTPLFYGSIKVKPIHTICIIHLGCSYCPPPFVKAGDIKTHSSVCLSVRHKNFNLAHIFWSINDRALIFGMHHPCDKPFLLVPFGDLYLWPYFKDKGPLTIRCTPLPSFLVNFSTFAFLLNFSFIK